MEVMLEIGLMSDIFMNWRRAKSDIFYFSSCKSMKKCIYSSYIFQMMWNQRYLKKGEKWHSTFSNFNLKGLNCPPQPPTRFSKSMISRYLVGHSRNARTPFARKRMFRLWMWNTLFMKLTWFWDTEFQHFEK